MSKSNQRQKHITAPNSAQIDAVRRLIDGGDTVQARKRLDALRKSYPDFKPLLKLAWDIEDSGGHPVFATARAYEWHRAAPRSGVALRALSESSLSAGYSAICACALQRLSAIENEQDDLKIPQSFDSELGTMSLEQAEAIDLSRMHLADGNSAAAIAVLKNVDHPSARNNLALALFISGDLVQARDVIEANWRAYPDNLFALESAVRWRCWVDGLDRCMGFAAPLQHTRPRRVEDAMAQITALRFLGDEKAVQRAWQSSKNASYWHDAADSFRKTFVSLKEPGSELPGSSYMWFPEPWIKQLTKFIDKNKISTESQWNASCEAEIASCDAHVDYLVRAVDLGDATTRFLALSVLKQRAKRSDPAATAGLETLLTHSNGPDKVRMDTLHWFTEQGLKKRSDPVQIWLSGKLQTIRSYDVCITDEPRPCHLSPEGAAIHEQVLQAVEHHQYQKALILAQTLFKMYPDDPLALSNLAAIKEGLGHSVEEVAALYRRAYELAPDYLFARCGLARCHARKGKLKEAHHLLDGLMEREQFHRTEYRSLLLTQKALASAAGNHDAKENLSRLLFEFESLQGD